MDRCRPLQVKHTRGLLSIVVNRGSCVIHSTMFLLHQFSEWHVLMSYHVMHLIRVTLCEAYASCYFTWCTWLVSCDVHDSLSRTNQLFILSKGQTTADIFKKEWLHITSNSCVYVFLNTDLYLCDYISLCSLFINVSFICINWLVCLRGCFSASACVLYWLGVCFARGVQYV